MRVCFWLGKCILKYMTRRSLGQAPPPDSRQISPSALGYEYECTYRTLAQVGGNLKLHKSTFLKTLTASSFGIVVKSLHGCSTGWGSWVWAFRRSCRRNYGKSNPENTLKPQVYSSPLGGVCYCRYRAGISNCMVVRLVPRPCCHYAPTICILCMYCTTTPRYDVKYRELG
jgi:hypothetical protein